MTEALRIMKPLSWEDVFGIWRENEYSVPAWQKLAKERGFDSWEEWRMTYVRQLGLGSLVWQLFEVTSPVIQVPHFHCGPFQNWRKYYQGKNTIPFKRMVDLPVVKENNKVITFLENFPFETTIIGVRVGESVVIVEGTHRCMALALANAQNKKIDTHVFIALADYPVDKPLPQLQRITK